ncbi:MAG: PQQ-dependent sugar dehydrogenase [Bacteroidota bacterium]
MRVHLLTRTPRLISRLLLVTFLIVSSGCAQTQEVPHGAFVTSDGVGFRVEVVARGLQVPWSLAFAGDDLYFTERRGTLNVLRKNSKSATLIASISDVRATGEGGLMGLAFHPDFTSNRLVYLSYTYNSNGHTLNKVMRYVFGDSGLSRPLVVVDGIPGAGVHNGNRIKFGPDGKLYITTGDAAQRQIAQDMNSLGGKILRVNDDGSIPADNPFPRSRVFSVGHRNPQGIVWDPVSKTMFSAEHGPSGFDGPGGGDEINLIEAGKNYGWPIVHHQQSEFGMMAPLLEFTPAIAPGGVAFASPSVLPGFDKNLFIATLRGAHLLRVIFKKNSVTEVSHTELLLEDVYGRLRDVILGPDGHLYFCTSNRDGRGSPNNEDDRILRIIPVE